MSVRIALLGAMACMLAACGGSSSNRSATVADTALDTTAPVVSAPSPITVESSDGNPVPASAPEIANYLAAATATDDVDGTIGTVSNDAPADFPVGTTNVTFSATDTAGNTGTAVSAVTVTDGSVDTTAPVVSAPSPITVESSDGNPVPASDTEIANFLAAATATDDVDGTIGTVSNDAPADFPVGTTSVIFSATDTAGNTGTAVSSVTITVSASDTTPPVVDVPAPISVESSDGSPIPASEPAVAAFLAAATATDGVDGTIGTVSNDAPADFPVGTTDVTFSATDAAGNTGTAVSSVTVTEASMGEVIFFQETDSVGGQVERNEVFLVSIDEGTPAGTANIEVIHQWPNDLQAQEGSPAYLTEAGLALVSGASFNGFPSVNGVLPSQATPVRHGTGAHGVLRLLEPDGTIAWQYIRCDYENNGSGGLSAGEYCLHHDVEPMPNGNILAPAHRKVPRATLEAQAGWINNNASADFLWIETVFELRPVFGPGSEAECLALSEPWSTAEPWCTEEVWTMDLLDYLGSATDDPQVINVNLIDATTRTGGTQYVQLHINSISYNESRDEIILSSLIYGEFFIFDRASKAMLYRWGNPNNYACNGAMNSDFCGQVTEGQHDVAWVDDSTVRIHNNNRGPGPDNPDDPDCFVGDCSKVIEIVLPLDGAGDYVLGTGTPYGPFPYLGPGLDYEVLYGPFSTVFASGSQHYANGDILLTKTNSRELRRLKVTDPAGTDTGTGPGTVGDWVWNVEVPYLEQVIDPDANIYQPASCFNSPIFGYSCAQIFKSQLLDTGSINVVNFMTLKGL